MPILEWVLVGFDPGWVLLRLFPTAIHVRRFRAASLAILRNNRAHHLNCHLPLSTGSAWLRVEELTSDLWGWVLVGLGVCVRTSLAFIRTKDGTHDLAGRSKALGRVQLS